jgi:hypothetical protein
MVCALGLSWLPACGDDGAALSDAGARARAGDAGARGKPDAAADAGLAGVVEPAPVPAILPRRKGAAEPSCQGLSGAGAQGGRADRRRLQLSVVRS